MILTNNKTEVSYAMLQNCGMTRGGQIGIPVDPADPSLGLRWRDLGTITDAEYDALEEYFIRLEQQDDEQH